jgi:uncharacterized protein YjgD (DUF1641 family)
MPDTPVEPAPRAPYDPSMEQRVSRLEEDMHEIKAAHGRLETMVSDVRLAVTRIEATLTATLPHLATKAEVTEILKTLPHLATKAEIAEVRIEMAEMVKTLPHLATRAEVAEVKVEMAEMVKTLPHLATKAEVAEVSKTLPHLATRAALAEKPGKGYLVGMIGILLAAYAAGLAALAVLK